jgi:hypothetical protein
MSYLTTEMAREAIQQMKSFHDKARDLYRNFDMDLLDNLGRRNIIMSQTQEKFFAQALSKKYEGVREDGRTGEPDIVIEELDKELECKLTSRHKSGSISFQSDFETLQKKGSLDYLYVIADQEFKKFSVLLFEGLTTDDFRPLSTGARGKVAMFKHKGMKKCRQLLGDCVSLNDINILKCNEKLSNLKITPSQKRKAEKSLKYWQETPTKYRFSLEAI